MPTAFRHILCLLLCGCALFGAGSALAKERLVAVVMTADMPRYREAHRAFVKTLAQKGFDDARVDIVLQTPNPDPISWANSVRKMQAIGADLLITYGAPVTLAAIQETRDLPLVFADVYDPVETGVCRSLSSAGKQVCGISAKSPLTTLVKIMGEIRPVRKMGVLYNSKEAGSVAQLREMRRLAAQFGFAVVEANISTSRSLESALAYLLGRADCLYVSESSVVSAGMETIVQRATAKRVPVISQVPDSADHGALVSLQVSPAEQGRQAAEYAAEVLRGRSPGQLPVASPRKADLVINLKVAKSLELTVPFDALSAATRLIK